MLEGQTSPAFPIKIGVRQGDALLSVLFNLALYKTVKNLDPWGTIINRTRQILAYADDIALIGRNVCILEDVFGELERDVYKRQVFTQQSLTANLTVQCDNECSCMCRSYNADIQLDPIGLDTFLSDFLF